MPKYRLLTHEELIEFENEFVEFLIVNGITAPDWVKMKETQPKEAVKIIGSFSDVIFEGTMRKIEFLEVRTSKEVRCFHCLKDKMILVGMRVPKESDMDFTNIEMVQMAMTTPPKNIEFFTAEKDYENIRETELFEMTQVGCSIADGRLYKSLATALAES
ncbi:MAG: DUF6495 family protein [Salibacteraceae bacterium]